MTKGTPLEASPREPAAGSRFLDLLVENSPEGMVICDREKRILLANAEFCRLFGYERNEVLSREVDEIIASSPDIRKEARSVTSRAFKGPYALPDVARQRKDGTHIPVSVMAGPIMEGGKIVGLYGIYRDNSDKKAAAEQIRREKTFFESLFHNSPEAIIICDRNERIVRVNKEFCTLFGYTEEEVRGRDGNEVVANRPDLCREARELDERMWASGKKVFLDTVRTRKDGSTVPVSVVQVPFSLEDGTMYDYSIYVDITERRQAETASKRERSFFEKLFEASPEAIIVLDRSSRIRRANPAFCRLFGYSEEEVSGRKAWEIVAQDPAIIAECREYDKKFWAGETVDAEVVRQTKGGKRLDLALTQVPIDIEEEGVLCYVIYRDMGERVRAEQETRRHLHFERLVSFLSSLFLTSGLSTETLERSLDEAGTSLGATHGWIVLCDHDGGNPCVEASWSASGKDVPLPESLPSGTAFKWLMRHLGEEGISLLHDIGNIPFRDAPESSMIRASMIQSCLAAALSIDRDTGGFVLFGKTAAAGHWEQTDLSAARIYANILDQAFRRFRAEEALRLSEQRARRILQEQNDFLLRFSPDMVVTFANDAYCRFLGKPPREVVGAALGTVMINKTIGEFRRFLTGITPENPVLKSEEIYHMPSGERRWVQWIDRGLYDGEGRLLEIQSEGRDITELKLTGEALEKSEKRYQAIVNDQIEMVGRFRPDGTIIFANPALAENLGLDPEEVEGRNLFELLHRDVARPLGDDLKALSPDNPCIFREHEFRTPSGGFRWERWSDLGIFNEDGELVEIQGVGRDFTELKRSQKELNHLNAVLKSIRGINRLINKQKDKNRLIQGICAHLIETRGYGNVWIALLEKRGCLATVTEAGISDQGRPMAETLEHEELNAWGRNVLETPGVIVSRHASPRTDCPLLENYGEKAIMTARLEHGGSVYGLISVSLPEGFSADGEERTLFLEVAQDISFALHAIDIDSDREKAVQQLREKARQVELLMRDRPDGLWVWDRQGDTLFFNESYEKNLGYDPGEIHADRARWEAMIHPEDLPRVRAVLDSRLDHPEAGDLLELEYRIKAKDGNWKWVTDRGHIVERDEEGKAVRVSGTQTVRNGASLDPRFHESWRNLAEALCERCPGGVLLHWDENSPDPGRVFAADRTACDMAGYRIHELVGKNVTDILGTGHEAEGPPFGEEPPAVLLAKNGGRLSVRSETFRFTLLGRPAAATFFEPRGSL